MDSEVRLAEDALSVLVDVPAITHPLDYLPPAGVTTSLAVGTMVRVPLHGRTVNGWVLGLGTGTSATLQNVKKVKGFGPPEQVLELAAFAAWRYAGSLVKFLRAASPPRNITSLLVPPALGAFPSSSSGLSLPAREGTSAQVVTLGATEDPFGLVGQVLREVHASGQLGTTLIVTPTLGYAERLTARLQRAGISAVGPGHDQWLKARSGWPVVVGPRSIAFAPVERLSAVVILDAHEGALQEEQSPTWSAVTLLEERARREGAPCWLMTPLAAPMLSFERVVAPAVGSRTSDAWPEVEVVDFAETDPRHRLLTEPFVDRAKAALEISREPGTVVCLFHRTGRAKLLSCRSCDQLVVCHACGGAMHERLGTLVCARCSEVRPLLCSGCGSMALKIVRPGVSRLAEELRALFQLDVDEVTAATPEESISAPLVVGTEAVLHRVRRSVLVCVLDLDQYLLAPRMRSEEATLEMLIRSARLVGSRTERRGQLLIQTRQVHHEVVEGLKIGDMEGVMRELSERRQRLLQPPFVAYGRLKGEDADEYGEALSATGGVTYAALGEGRGLVIGSSTAVLCDALRNLPRGRRRVTISVDPEDL